MTKFIGYIGVVNVTVSKETYDDTAVVTGVDPAWEVSGFEVEFHSLMAAYRYAVGRIKDSGGCVTSPTPKGKYRVIGCSSDIIEVPQTDLIPWDKAIMELDAKAAELEYGMCAGWSRSGDADNVRFTDKDGYEMRLFLINEKEDARRSKEFYDNVVSKCNY